MQYYLNIIVLLMLLSVNAGAQGYYPDNNRRQGVNGSVRLTNLARINTPYEQFSPMIYGNGLVYVSRYQGGPVNPKTGETYFKLFYTDLDGNGMDGRPQLFSQQLTSAFNEGPVAFNRAGNRIFFTRNNIKNGVKVDDAKGENNNLKIYEAWRGPFDWEDISELPFNNNNYTCMQPALSPDEKRLFFTSNMPGGYGGFDLYFVEFINGRWSEPINLGPEINTSRNEATPFLHESGILFFSSRGHRGSGGLDLFMIDISGRQWGQVINLGYPFNTPEDDLGLVLTPSGERGYFTSARQGGRGRDDIYLFEAPQGIRGIELPRQQNAIVTVYDGTSSSRLSGASLRLFEMSTDGSSVNEELYNVELLPNMNEQGEMVMKMIRKRDQDLGQPDAMTDRRGEGILPIKQNQEYLLLVSKPGYFSQEFQFVVNENGANRPLEVIIQPNNCVSLGGYVKADRLSMPVAGAWVKVINKCDGREDLVRTNVHGYFETCISIGCEFTIIAEKEGFAAGQSSVSTINLGASRSLEAELFMTVLDESALREPIRQGTKIVLDNIYYDFNKSSIRRGSASDLEALAQLMNAYPSMEIELGAHTDSRGETDYNLNLSLRRAESATQFLVDRGVAARRIRAIGYGEAEPRNHCTDGVNCSEEEYKINRRTEVKVLHINEQLNVNYNKDGVIIRQR